MTAQALAEKGATVLMVCRNERKGDAALREIKGKSKNGNVKLHLADLSLQKEIRRLADEIRSKYPKIDVLVNNAGIADRNMPINLCTEEWYDEIIKVDQYSVYYMSKYALEHMEKAGQGSIVNVSSIGSQGITGIAYSAAKAAVNAMTKNIALQYSPTKIRCNAVAPGPTPTALNAPEAFKLFDKEFLDACNRHMDWTLPKAQAEDQAEAILFFACDASKAVTGQILYVDHGTTLY